MEQQTPAKMHASISYSQFISSSLTLYCSCPTGYGYNQSCSEHTLTLNQEQSLWASMIASKYDPLLRFKALGKG